MTRLLSADGLSPRVTPDDWEDLASGRAEMLYGTHRRLLKMTPRIQPLFDAAKVRGWLMLPTKGDDRLRSLWFYWCEAQQIPFVVIQPKRRLVEVRMDLIVLDRKPALEPLRDSILDLCRRYQQDMTCYAGTLSQLFVLPEHAEVVAVELIRLAANATMRETPKP